MMQTPITKDNIASFAATNVDIIREGATPRALVLEFHGLGDGLGLQREQSKLGIWLAERDILYAIPYSGPWSWMNDKAVRYIDECADALFARFSMPENTPVVATGLSMGGLGALTYTRYARRTPAACAAICPVCDLPYHYTERPDLPRTIYGAFSHYDMPLDEAMKTASPIHQAESMPDIPYLIFATTADTEVAKTKHADRLVPVLRDAGRSIEYFVIPDRGHCDLSDEGVARYREFISSYTI